MQRESLNCLYYNDPKSWIGKPHFCTVKPSTEVHAAKLPATLYLDEGLNTSVQVRYKRAVDWGGGSVFSSFNS